MNDKNDETWWKIQLGGPDIKNAEFIPLVTDEDSENGPQDEIPNELPILPLRNTVLFPGVIIPISVGRNKSVKLIKAANKGNKLIGVVSQRDPEIEDPHPDDLYRIGTVARIVKMVRMPDGSTTAIIQGKHRFEWQRITASEPYLKAEINLLKGVKATASEKLDELIGNVRAMAERIVELSPNIPTEANIALKSIDSPNFLVNFISSNLNIGLEDKQGLLEIAELTKRAEMVLEYLVKELQMLEVKNQIHSKVRTDIDKQQREYFLHQQIRAIQEELGQDNPDMEIEQLRMRGDKKKWDDATAKAFNKELDKLQRMNPSLPDYSVGLNYVELLLDLPWNEYSKDNFDLDKARKVLDADHFGMEKVKKRILEYLAVLKLKGDMKSPILCLYGPPGVGKTSLGKSIAKAVGRKYVRMSLGGLHDEAELRGHRKTYIGAMPGRIIQSLKKANTSNPVFVLDEIDKIGNSFRGDPSSALLEILDPEQNNAFHDNYVDLDYDLSKIMFIATANRLDTVQPALLDRMEIIEINGYTQEEKVEIAKKFLIPKQRKAHGLKAGNFKLSDSVISRIIDEYTRESGVRGLEKRIASLARARAKQVVNEEKFSPAMNLEEVFKTLGSNRIEKELYQDSEVAGVVTGLAWTSVGGEILYVESTLTRGKGKLTLTGQLGDVMKESALTASTFLKAHCDYLDLDYRLFDQYDIHIHFPAGAVPKDGPSAGITILTSLASLFTQRRVRSNLAMTGEITLRGKVLPVGGIKEKILAAKRAGVTHIILSEVNKKDVEDIEPHYIEGLSFHYVKNMLEVLDLALLEEKVKKPLKLEVLSNRETEMSDFA
ncbi:MAG: endopeptidase La [Flavobacteriales bacterium]|nr:endopeptidase La [Flavobacteriales bacterium]